MVFQAVDVLTDVLHAFSTSPGSSDPEALEASALAMHTISPLGRWSHWDHQRDSDASLATYPVTGPETEMPPLQAHRRPLCFFLYPPRRTQSVRLLHIQPSERRCKGGSTNIQRKEKGNTFRSSSDLGLLEGDHSPQPQRQLLEIESHSSRFSGTFIRPTGPRMPSLFTDPRRRMRIEWHWARKKFETFSM